MVDLHQDLSKILFSCFASNMLLALISYNIMITSGLTTDSSITNQELTLITPTVSPSTTNNTTINTASTTTPSPQTTAASTNKANVSTSPLSRKLSTTQSPTTSPMATTTSKTTPILPSSSSVSPSVSALTESSSSTASITSTLESTDYTTTITEAPTPAPSTETPQVTIPLQITKTPPNFKYITFDPDIGNDCRRFDYEFNEEYIICTHKCENINCLNGGECAVTVEGKDRITVGCRCPSTEDLVYSGTTCENSQMSRLNERRITLGILIPIVFLSLLLLICVYAKLRHYGSTERSFRNNNYNVNTGNL